MLAYLLIFLFINAVPAQRFDLWQEEERERTLQKAREYAQEKPITITAYPCPRSAGGIHDYFSEGDYWWPDPNNPTGPYIQRDGLSNPDNFIRHRQLLWRLSQIVPTLVVTYHYTHDQGYLDLALAHLNAWFVEESTRMNPHLRFAQAVTGRATGRSIGIIDTIHLVEVARAIQVLEKEGYVPTAVLVPIKEWFREYLEWLYSSDFGKAERDQGNNHSTCWAMQVAQFAQLLGDTSRLDFCRHFFKTVLVPNQFAVDGSFPRELRRTKPYCYSLFNLDAMATLCQILSTAVDNLWYFETPDGRGMRRAVEFMYPFVLQKNTWPYPADVMYAEYWPIRHPF